MFDRDWLVSAFVATALTAVTVLFAIWFISGIDKEHTACNVKGGTFSYDYRHKKYVCSK